MISGIVVDENGDPLPAAHIRQVSQTKGEELAAVITDMNGHFRLNPAPHSERDRNLFPSGSRLAPHNPALSRL